MGSRKHTNINCKSCSANIKVRNDYLKRHQGLCKKCQNKSAPFEAQYNRMLQQNSNWGGNLTFSEFLEFTLINECHYCLSTIEWFPFRVQWNENGTKGKDRVKYNLDRKNSFRGYDLDNLVVCCERCNYGKSNLYSYEEWFGMTKYFRDLCPIK